MPTLEMFLENANEFIASVRRTGQSLTLTINGEPAVIVQDVASHRRLRHLAAQASVEEGIRLGLEDIQAGRTRPAQEVFDELRTKYNIPR